jgi:hypothetical protein
MDYWIGLHRTDASKAIYRRAWRKKNSLSKTRRSTDHFKIFKSTLGTSSHDWRKQHLSLIRDSPTSASDKGLRSGQWQFITPSYALCRTSNSHTYYNACFIYNLLIQSVIFTSLKIILMIQLSFFSHLFWVSGRRIHAINRKIQTVNTAEAWKLRKSPYMSVESFMNS